MMLSNQFFIYPSNVSLGKYKHIYIYLCFVFPFLTNIQHAVCYSDPSFSSLTRCTGDISKSVWRILHQNFLSRASSKNPGLSFSGELVRAQQKETGISPLSPGQACKKTSACGLLALHLPLLPETTSFKRPMDLLKDHYSIGQKRLRYCKRHEVS